MDRLGPLSAADRVALHQARVGRGLQQDDRMPIRLCALSSVVVLFCATAAQVRDLHAQEAVKLTFDGQRAKEYVAHLSTDEMQGRMSCTEGYRKSADWVAGNF